MTSNMVESSSQKARFQRDATQKKTHYAFVWKLGTVIYSACTPMGSDDSRPIYNSLVI